MKFHVIFMYSQTVCNTILDSDSPVTIYEFQLKPAAECSRQLGK